MGLTNSQKEIYSGIIADVESGVKRIKLVGSAGVGKTYLVGQLVAHFVANPKGMSVFATAPTNKALAVLKSKLKGDDRLILKTIHSALRLSRYVNPRTGQVTFTPSKYSHIPYKEDIKFGYVCFVDESSMLNQEILTMLEDLPICIIFVGDDKQLNPVGEAISPIWEKDYKTYTLTEIIRQGQGNPIIELSQDLDIIFFKRPQLVDDKGYTFSEDRIEIINSLAEVNGTDELKYLSWTNVDVDTVNSATRRRIYGTPMKVEKGETLVFNTPYGSFYTSEEVKVEDLKIYTDSVSLPTYETKISNRGDIQGRMDSIRLKFYVINGGIKVIHEDSEGIFKAVSKELELNCKKFAWNWRAYYFFIEQFADIKYNHALTVHKSQGSTYKTSIINIGNICFNKNAVEKERMLYTAVTRASDLVILNNVK